jgi:hypothetical protein
MVAQEGTLLRRAWFAVVVALLPVALAGPLGAQEWQEYRPADAGYRIEFPGTPTVTTRQADPITITLATLSRGSAAFISSHSAMPAGSDLGDPQKLLDGARDGGVRNVNGTLRDEQHLSVSGAPARRLVIDVPQRGLVVLMVAALRGIMLYQALHVGPPGTEDSADARHFVESLSLVDR